MKDIKTKDSVLKKQAGYIKEAAQELAQEFDYGKEQRDGEENGGNYATNRAERGVSGLPERAARSVSRPPQPSRSGARKRTVTGDWLHNPRLPKEVKSVKEVRKTVKGAQTAVNTTSKAAKTAAKSSKAAAKTAQKTAQAAKDAAKATAQGVKAVVKAATAVAKTLIAAVQGLIAAIAAGGWVAVVIILLICFIAYIAASPFGLFLSTEGYDGGASMPEVVQQLNEEFYNEMERIKSSYAHDVVEIQSSDGRTAVDWVAVLRVYAVLSTTGTENEMELATLDDDKIKAIKSVMWELNAVAATTHTEQREIEVTKTDVAGSEYTETEVVTETVLTIQLQHFTETEILNRYHFSPVQSDLFREMNEPAYQSLWVSLVGSYRDSGGQILFTDSAWVGTGLFAWPLQNTFEISSTFGWRTLRGEPNYHEALDIAAPYGTPILAAADGEVIVSNATDIDGFGYGLYVKIRHDDTYVTTYAHCSAVAVLEGQQVVQGQVIGYVGSTGNSTGNHVHFEVVKNGVKVDPLQLFHRL